MSRPVKNVTGMRFGRLTAVSHAGFRRRSNGYTEGTWLCRCDCGEESIVLAANLLKGHTTSCGCRQREITSARSRRTTVTYGAAHRRIYRLRGKASQYACVDCGEAAKDWSYDGNDPNELPDPGGWVYSQDPAYYVPRCRFCHRGYDARLREQRAANGGASVGHSTLDA